MNDTVEFSDNNTVKCVSFTVSSQVYCLNIMSIREIRRWASVTTLPHAGAHVLGVINLRGSVIPVYDLSVHFGLGETVPSPRNVVIIADIGGESLGLLVESVSEILTFNRKDVQDPPRMGRGGDANLIEGLISVGDDMAQLINLGSIAKDHEVPAA